MANLEESLSKIAEVSGFLGVSVVDGAKGKTLHCEGDRSAIDLELAAVGITRMVQAKSKAITHLDSNDRIEDILITLGTQYYLIRPLLRKEGHFVFIVLDKSSGNLAMARFLLGDVEKAMAL